MFNSFNASLLLKIIILLLCSEFIACFSSSDNPKYVAIVSSLFLQEAVKLSNIWN